MTHTEWGGRPPRRWQAEALPLVREALRENARGGPARALVAGTGAGKATLLAEVAASTLATLRQGWCVVVSVPNVELVGQLADTMRGRLGAAEVGEWFGDRKQGPTETRRVVVACTRSLPTLADHLTAQGAPGVAVMLVDECHRDPAAVVTFRDRVKPRAMTGCTATPYRANEPIEYFEPPLIYRYGYDAALRDGVVVPFRVVDYERRPGEEPALADDAMIDMLRMHGIGRRAVIDGYDIADAEAYATRLVDAGFRAHAVHSELPKAERRRRLDALRDGDVDAVVQVATLVEGFDLPAIDLIGLRRPLRTSIGRFVQLVGRGARTAPGKVDCVILNPCRIRIVQALGKPEELGEAMEALARQAANLDDEDAQPVREERVRVAEMAVAVSALSAWCDEVTHGLIMEGTQIRAMNFAITGGLPASPKQLEHLAKFVADRRKSPIRWFPAHVRDALYEICGAAHVLDRQTASDLLGVLFGARQAYIDHLRDVPYDFSWRPAAVANAAALPDGVLDAYRAEATAVAAGALPALYMLTDDAPRRSTP